MIRGSLIIRCMAGIAIGRKPGVDPAAMALRAIQPGMAAGQGERGVIESGRQPSGRAMAFFTVVRVVSGNVVRPEGEICAMAGVTIL